MHASKQDITDLHGVLSDVVKGLRAIAELQATAASSQPHTNGHVEDTTLDISTAQKRARHRSLPVKHRDPAKLSLEVSFVIICRLIPLTLISLSE